MNRREFLTSAAALAAACLVGSSDDAPPVMQHAYMDGDGEVIAANSLEQAARYLECELGGDAEPDLSHWHQCDDDAIWAVEMGEDGGDVERKTFREWAAEHCEPGYISTTYC